MAHDDETREVQVPEEAHQQATQDGRPASAGAELRPGERIEGRYEVLGTVGKGAMGAVFRARDRQTGREVALKFLLEVDPAGEKRFLREGEILASLNHPGIVRIHSRGVYGRRPYLVCELVEGARTLDEAAASASAEQKVRWVAEAARAVGHAHQHGVVHRDLKPGNLLVDLQGRVRVVDFGVATGEALLRLTRTGVVVGTPLYLAPERIAGQGTGAASDVWALGVVLHELCAGEVPFQAETFAALATAICEGARAPLTDVRPSIPRAAALEQVVARSLERPPERRFASGDALADALEGYLAGSEPGPERRLGLLVGAALLAVGVFLGLLLSFSPGPRTEPPHDTAHDRAEQDPADRGHTDQPTVDEDGDLAAGRRLLFAESPDTEGALRHFLRAAAAGSGDAMGEVSRIELWGWAGRERNLESGQAWMRRAAAAGEPWALYRLGGWYLLHSGEAERAEGRDLLFRASEAGHPLAAVHWASVQLRRAPQPEDVLRFLRERMPRDPEAELLLALLEAQEGRPGSLRRLATGGPLSARARMLMAELLQEGSGVPRDSKRAEALRREALALFVEAAEAGDARARLAQATCVRLGLGTAGDEVRALRLARRAAAKGCVEAQHVVATGLWRVAEPLVLVVSPRASTLFAKEPGRGSPLQEAQDGLDSMTPERARVVRVSAKLAAGEDAQAWALLEEGVARGGKDSRLLLGLLEATGEFELDEGAPPTGRLQSMAWREDVLGARARLILAELSARGVAGLEARQAAELRQEARKRLFAHLVREKEQASAESMLCMSLMLRLGIGGAVFMGQAERLAIMAAEAGSQEALRGLNGERWTEIAGPALLVAAPSGTFPGFPGMPRSPYAQGLRYRWQTPPAWERARDVFMQAAGGGSVRAMRELSEILLHGPQRVRNVKTGLRFLQRAANLGEPWALESIARRGALEGPDHAKAKAAWSRAAEAGLPEAGVLVALSDLMLRNGAEAERFLLEEAAAGGIGEVLLLNLLRMRWATPPNRQRFVQRYEALAQGNGRLGVRARAILAELLDLGELIPADPERAEALRAEATELAGRLARAGDHQAALLYGLCLHYGLGVEADPVAGRRWVRVAAMSGDGRARRALRMNRWGRIARTVLLVRAGHKAYRPLWYHE